MHSQANVKSKAPLESIFSSGPLIPTFAKVPAAMGCECWNRTTSRACFGFNARSPRLPVTPPVVAMPSPMATMAPASMPAVMMMPAHLGRQLPGVILHRCRGTRIDQRHRTCTLDRRSHHQDCGDRRKTQNFRPVHLVPPLKEITPAPYGSRPSRRDADGVSDERRECGLNSCATKMNAHPSNRFRAARAKIFFARQY